MPRFTFPVPGRKKQTPQVTVTSPPMAMSKAQRILGATALNIDGSGNWEDMSSSGISINVSETTAPTSYGSTIQAFGNQKRENKSAPERQWEEESDVVPRHLMVEDYVVEDDATDMASILRKKQSSSTLVSWYDRSKQPLAISQQTSASAMAKGFPSKAQRMLDIDNLQAPKMKKKPSKLDLSNLLSRARSHQQSASQAWNGPLLEPDHVVKSPSVMSNLSLTSGRGHRLRKRPTKESLHSQKTEAPRPGTSGSNRRPPNHLTGLPDLYEHYEQMSFRQILDPDAQEGEEDGRGVDEPLLENVPHSTIEASRHDIMSPSHHDERVVSKYASRVLPETPQTTTVNKSEPAPASDCAASISSRHTRTSKASKRTNASLPDSDLLEKSVLSLSSDSEEDAFSSIHAKSVAPVAPRSHGSDAESTNNYRPTTARTASSVDSKRLSRSSKGSKRASFATSNTYLTIPYGSSVGRPNSISGKSVDTIPEKYEGLPARRESTMSTCSTSIASTWQSRAGYGIQEARTFQMPPTKTVTEEDDDDEYYRRRDSAADQPTPPLSPSSVDFYIRSAHSSIDGPGGHNRFMAVTHQEEMLLAALRNKRQAMRDTILSEFEDERTERRPSKGHKSIPSEATVTDTDLDFDFPAPPTCKDKTTVSASGNKVLDLSSSPPKGAVPRSQSIDSRASRNSGGGRNSRTSIRSSYKQELLLPRTVYGQASKNEKQERILLYLDDQKDSNSSMDGSEPRPSLDFLELHERESYDSELPEEVLYARQRQRRDRSSSTHKAGPRLSGRSDVSGSSSNRTIRAGEERRSYGELEVPRPDSPISPVGLAAPPAHKRSNFNKKMARLSAVGTVPWGNED